MIFRRDMMEVALFPWRSLFIICTVLCMGMGITLLPVSREHDQLPFVRWCAMNYVLIHKRTNFTLNLTENWFYSPFCGRLSTALSYRTETSHGSTTYLSLLGKGNLYILINFQVFLSIHIFHYEYYEDWRWTSCVAAFGAISVCRCNAFTHSLYVVDRRHFNS